MQDFKFHLLSMLFIVIALFCNANTTVMEVTPTSASCFEKADGKINVKLKIGSQEDGLIIILDSNNLVVQQKALTSVNEYEFQNLRATIYTVYLQAGAISEKIDTRIISPSILKLEIIQLISAKENGNLVNASLQAFPEGGTMPYEFKWSENTGNQNTPIAKTLSLGVYNCIVTDRNSCGPVEATFYLFEDEITKYKESNPKKN